MVGVVVRDHDALYRLRALANDGPPERLGCVASETCVDEDEPAAIAAYDIASHMDDREVEPLRHAPDLRPVFLKHWIVGRG
jgi:hypothetical protein